MSTSPNYAGTKYSDGPNASTPFTLGRHNKWGYLVLVGPDRTEHTIGLIDTFDVEEDNGSTFLPQAGSDWLELQIGSRMWRGTLARKHIRGASIKELLQRIYPAAGDIDFRYLPFIWKYRFSYNPPIGAAQPYEQASW